MYLKIFLFVFVTLLNKVTSRSFSVDYDRDCFLKDGNPFRYVSGSIHYFRVPNALWYDRISKMKMAGLNAIQTYVEWNNHEPEPGIYNFEGDYNLPKFLKIANDLGMVVILRAGPFIDAERDMGGLPYWLLRIDPNMNLRQYDQKYISAVDRWFGVLASVIKPFLYENGGPIITLQIENEYGSTGLCDAQYKSHLRDFFRQKLDNKVVLFTTDGCASSALQCGRTDEVLSTMDFGSGSNVTDMYELMRWNRASGPIINSEFYPGWLDHWGQPHANVSTDAIVKTLTDMLKANFSVNIYMFHGGTSFGFGAGSNLGSTFQACPTSYDYDAPLNEAGDPTPKYFAMREAIGKFLPLPGPVPKPQPKMKLPPINLKMEMSLWDYIEKSNQSVSSPVPLSFENLYHPYGFVLYETKVPFFASDPSVLAVKGIADRGYVFVNKVLQGILSREQKVETIPIHLLKGDSIQILVENQGRVCFGSGVNDRKGIFQNVTLGTRTLLDWTMTPVPLDKLSLKHILSEKQQKSSNVPSVPAIYSAQFTLPNKDIFDTFLKLDGWHKGVAFLNKFNLGRYWPIVGPQVTMYVPSILFRKAPLKNELLILELEESPCKSATSCSVQFVDVPIVNGTTPLNSKVQPSYFGKKFLRENARYEIAPAS